MSESGINRWINAKVRIDLEVLVYVLLILLAVLTRFYDLDTRVMSHDESLHTWFSWQLNQGRGFAHDPMMHGPLQFHLVSLSYFLFGDSDATSRIPAALAGVLAVGMIFLFRRWLGRWGGLVATALMVISPYMLYYSRYVRNEALVVPLVLLMVYAVFRYFEDRRDRWLYLLAASLSLHYATKETAFIYIAQLMLFLGGYLAWRLINLNWKQTWHKVTFLIGFFSAALGTMITLYALFRERALTAEIAQATEIARFSPFVTFGLILALTGIS
ncbi:MAG: TIGR03663 family protein, partial [Anaerolineales bacterium]|nr:TIGR03663 family protein [Anaerolineales bacterium]